MCIRDSRNMPEIEPARAVLLTESYKETEGEPIIMRRAKAFAHIPVSYTHLGAVYRRYPFYRILGGPNQRDQKGRYGARAGSRPYRPLHADVRGSV